ncbi:MAG TPA: MBL fold metallo-hydrolase [Candidatus Polarisedimenticolia bacterium]|nr:MBL fold metallo-hydrolase [Candidatus Polarisedimenticolia bacterium]
MPTIAFHGAAGTVTGSRYLVTAHAAAGDEQVLIDCGMYQGLKDLRERNWAPTPFDATELPFVVLTHAHIDHSGMLPRLVKQGFKGAIISTQATYELAQLLLMDAAKLQEEDAEWLNKKGLSRHKPALPLFDADDARKTLEKFTVRPYGEWTDLPDHISFQFHNAGHLLGSAMVEMKIKEDAGTTTVLFSGDLGRFGVPLHPDPDGPPAVDYMVLESTYGGRDHDEHSLYDQLEKIVKETIARRGIVIVPAFAVGRAQQVIYVLNGLMEKGRLPALPIHLDSPMAVQALKIYANHPKEQESTGELTARNVICHSTVEESKALNSFQGPGILISSSGMLAGGRILHHLKRLLPEPRHTIVLAGYQAAGTRGRFLLEGAKTIRIHSEEIPVRAQVEDLCGFSGHADTKEILRWLGMQPKAPKAIFLTHGEPEAAQAMAERLRRERGLDTRVPRLGEIAVL